MERLYTKLTQRVIPSLNGLRAISVLMVLAFHFISHSFPGPEAVSAFFVLSGFLITHLLIREAGSTGDISLSRFYWRRMLRIFPAFYACWLLTVLAVRVNWEAAWTAFFYLSNYRFHDGLELDSFGHFWSLAVEEQFYLVWPPLFWWQRKNLVRLAWTVAGVVGAIQMYRLYLDAESSGRGFTYLYQAFDSRSSDLLIGCLLALCLHLRVKIPSWLLHPAAVLLPMTLIAITCWVSTISLRFSITYLYTMFGLAVALLLVQVILHSDRPFFSWLQHRSLDHLGRMSYSIYLFHMLPASVLQAYPTRWGVRVLLSFAGTFILASLSYYLIEVPLLSLKDRVWLATRRKEPRQPGLSPSAVPVRRSWA